MPLRTINDAGGNPETYDATFHFIVGFLLLHWLKWMAK